VSAEPHRAAERRDAARASQPAPYAQDRRGRGVRMRISKLHLAAQESEVERCCQQVIDVLGDGYRRKRFRIGRIAHPAKGG
jgi:hypothetical protein